MIIISNLNKYYENIKVLSDVNIHIEKGEIFGIIGHSGAGKSTLLRCINRLEDYEDGSILVEEKEVKDLSENELRFLRKDLGMIFQHFSLLERKTVFENVARNLSGGQKQRVAIARALALNPKVLLCDEATSALDPNTTKSILSLLQDINKKLNITIIMVTHQMEVIKQICSRVAIMEGGKVLEIGNTEELFLQNSKNLQKLVGEDEIVLPKGSNIRIIFPKEISNESIITSMARNLDIDFSIVCGRLEKYREDILGSLIINVSSKHKEKVKKYLDERHVRWEEIINED